MSVVYAETVYLRVEGGQLHRAYEIGGRLVDDGRCNLDDAARKSLVEEPEALAVEGDENLCGHCFPGGQK